jgi:membrane-associated protease RseP (regulator of RpoE activity)
MSEPATETPRMFSQSDFDKVTQVVTSVFQTEESLLENNMPTYYLKQPQETKQAFLKLLKNLKPMNLTPLLRRDGKRVVLRIIPKPAVKPSNILVNWALFLATIATTFITGYLLSEGVTDPLIGGVTFTTAIMIILGLHEMGHKLTADKEGIDATPPYFIPGPPPIGDFLGIGTFGAVIFQKSLPPNKDSLFDIGSSGPIMSFVLALAATIIGLMYSPMFPITGNETGFLPVPLIFSVIAETVIHIPSNYYVRLHPVAFAGWVGMLVTMLNLMPAAMLDGGHISRSLFGERTRLVLTAFSILSLIVISPIMAIFVFFMAMTKHPGPLDDVSDLSSSRKFVFVGLVVIFVLSSFLHYFLFYGIDVLRGLLGFLAL